ncbi:hypothetical protein [Prescottella equi]|nr:hypothetical protein [Prescottella equi]
MTLPETALITWLAIVSIGFLILLTVGLGVLAYQLYLFFKEDQ